jgi:hypothetical protein
MSKRLCVAWVRSGILIAALCGIAACTPSDYSDGINGFSQAVTAAANLGPPLATAAQQAAQNEVLRSLAVGNTGNFYLASECNVDQGNYHSGDCALLTGDDKKVAYVGQVPEMTSLTKYAAALSAVVADQTCTTLQTDAKGLATAASDIATKAGAKAAAEAAGPISQIVAASGCWAVNAEQLRILRTSTAAANPSIQLVVPLIAAAYDAFYVGALNDAHAQAVLGWEAYKRAQTNYQKSRSQSDLTKEQSSVTQMISLAAAIDKAKSAPPHKTVLQIATLHQDLTNDLQSPTVNLKRILNDAQTFVTEATSIASAAEALTKATTPPAKPTTTAN